jgi:hypothetical protein
MKSSFYSLIPFLPLFCNCQFRRLDSIQFLCSQVHILAGWRLETRLSTRLEYSLYCWTHFIATLHGPRRKHSLYYYRGMSTGPLLRNGCPSVAHVHFAGMCLPSHCLAMDIHVTIFTRISTLHSTINLQLFFDNVHEMSLPDHRNDSQDVVARKFSLTQMHMNAHNTYYIDWNNYVV